VEFSVYVTAGAVDGQSYYFRLTDGGTPLATYDIAAAQVALAFPWPPLPTVQPPAHNFHQPYSADTSSCAACHRVHTSPAPTVLYKAWPQEDVCFTCHDGSAAPDVFSQFAKPYRMPITPTSLIHTKDEPRDKDPLAFSGANRHVSCADCHNPHLAGQGTHTVGTNYTYGPQQGTWGVAVTNTAAWAAPAMTTVSPTTYQYQLCFKCHSSWAYGGSPPLSPSGGFPETDQAKEFNTLNSAYHPVEDVGKNPFTLAGGGSYASSLIGGFTPTSRMVCSDCHASETPTDAAGPHGSTNPFILRGAWDRTTGQSGTQDHVCFTCHAFSTYGEGANGPTGFSDDGGENLHGLMVGAQNKAFNDAAIGCMDCHVAIPHGYFRDHLIGYTGDGAPYIDRPYSGGLVVIDQWRASGQWQFNSCSTAMNSCK
jgi:predicted CXXCH cytochrome family protein